MGLSLAGCIGTNVNPLYTPAELEHQLNDSKAKAIVIIDLFGDKLDKVIANTGVKTCHHAVYRRLFPDAEKNASGFCSKARA